jgi:hypothetical protein
LLVRLIVLPHLLLMLLLLLTDLLLGDHHFRLAFDSFDLEFL